MQYNIYQNIRETETKKTNRYQRNISREPYRRVNFKTCSVDTRLILPYEFLRLPTPSTLPLTSRSLQYIAKRTRALPDGQKRSVPFVSCASAENLNEISIHEGIRVAKPVALRAQSSASKIDDVKFLSRIALYRATECDLFKRISTIHNDP